MALGLAVVGGGLAALTASLVAARHGIQTLLFEPNVPGGQAINVERIEDFPGFLDGVAGFDLGPTVQEQAAAAGAEFRPSEVTGLARADGGWRVEASDGEVAAPAVIFATGSRPRALGVPGEARLVGRGVSHCASCDAPLLRGRRVAVVGGGDSALQEALTLAAHAAEVVLVTRRDGFRAQRAYVDRALAAPNVRVLAGRLVEEVVGERCVEALRLRDPATGRLEQLEVAALFVYVGVEPNTELLRGLLDLDPDGRVPTDLWLRTAQPGLFAAGAVRRDFPGQAVNAAGDGATAAVGAHRYLAGDLLFPG